MSELLRKLKDILERPLTSDYPLPAGETEDRWRELSCDALERLASGRSLIKLDSRGTTIAERLDALISMPLPESLASAPGRAHLMGELIRNIDRPGRINQGLMGTCAVTSIESYLAECRTGEYVRLLTGLMSVDGVVSLQNDQALERDEELMRWSRREGRRSPVSRLFQVAAMAYAYPNRVYRNTFDGYVESDDAESSQPTDLISTGIDIEAFDRLLEGVTGERWDTLSEKHSRVASLLAQWGLDTSKAPDLREDGLDIIIRSAEAGEPTFVTLNTTDHPRASLPPSDSSSGFFALMNLPHKVRVLSVDLQRERITYEDPLDPAEPWFEGVSTRIEDKEGKCSMRMRDFEELMLEVSYKPRFWKWG